MLYFGIRQFRKKEAAEGVKSRAAQRAFQENVTDTPMRFTFEEDGFYVWEPSGSASYRYHALDAVWEDGERDYLILPGETVVGICRKALLQKEIRRASGTL